jgi:hypothetical protein
MGETLRSVIESKRRAISFDVPDELSEMQRRDGLTTDDPRKLGVKNWLLTQLTAAAPLSVWTQGTGLSPDKVLSARFEGPVKPLLLSAWITAAGKQRDEQWAAALLEHGEGNARELAPLVAIAPSAGQQLLRHALKDARKDTADRAAIVLAYTPGPWNAQFTRLAVAAAAQSTSPSRALPHIALNGDPSYEQAVRMMTSPALAPNDTRDTADTMRFRRDMITTLKENADV